MATVRPLLLALSLLVSVPGCGSPPLPTEPGVSLALAELRRGTLSEISYDVALEVPAERSEPVRGRTVVSFVWNDPRRRPLVLDFVEAAARVGSLEVNGSPARWHAENDHVVIDPGALRAGARNRVGITYRAGDGALNRADDLLYTLFVPDRARFSLPVFDQPDLRARFTLTLTVPDGWSAVANAPAQAEPPRVSLPGRDASATAADAGTWRFAETEPLPTYLFAFAAGRFQVEEGERGGRRFRMYHRETDAARLAANREALFDLHGSALAWLEAYTGLAYPFGKFDFVLIPAFQYGGMEHPGAIFYRQEALLLEASVTQADLLGRASLIAHETAHMWFGDLVTLRWFDDVWTKEVFANFLAAKIVRPSFPGLDHDLRFLMAHHPAAYRVDRSAGANPVRQPLANLQEAGTLYGPIIYQKAPVLMRQLERRLGEQPLREGLAEYLRTHAFSSAGWPDLVRVLDRRSTEDLASWSRVWVEEPGRPTVAVVLETEGGRVRRLGVRQEDPAGGGRLWPQRLTLALVRGEEVERVEVDLTGTEAWVEQAAGRPAPELVLPNASGLEYGRFVLDPGTLARLPARVGTLEPALLRGAAWLVLWDALLEGELRPEAWFDAAVGGLRTERDELNLQRILDTVGEVWWRYLPAGERARLAPAVEEALWQGAAGHPSPTARAAFFAAYRRLAVTREAGERLARLWWGEEASPVPLTEGERTALAWALALREAPRWERVLEAQGASITDPDRRRRFEFVRPALSADPAARARFFEALGDPGAWQREPWVLDALSLLCHPLRQRQAVQFIRPALETLEAVQRQGDIFFPDRWLEAVLGGHGSPAAAAEVQAFLRERPGYPPRLVAKILQASDGLFRAARARTGAAVSPP